MIKSVQSSTAGGSEQGILVLDLEDPVHPKQVAYLKADATFFVTLSGLNLYGDILFVSASNCIWVLDVSNPLQPEEISIFSPLETFDVTISGKYAFIANRGIAVADISNLANPEIIQKTQIPGYRLQISGNLLFSMDSDDVYITDISSPAAIKQIGYFANPGKASYTTSSGRAILQNTYFNDIAASGQYLYIASGIYGLRVVDISDPSNPREIPKVFSQSEAYAVSISGNLAFISSGDSFSLTDLSGLPNLKNPGSGDLGGYLDNRSNLTEIARNDNYLYVIHSIPPSIDINDVKPSN